MICSPWKILAPRTINQDERHHAEIVECSESEHLLRDRAQQHHFVPTSSIHLNEGLISWWTLQSIRVIHKLIQKGNSLYNFPFTGFCVFNIKRPTFYLFQFSFIFYILLQSSLTLSWRQVMDHRYCPVSGSQVGNFQGEAVGKSLCTVMQPFSLFPRGHSKKLLS